jgi:hypothetical protein
MPLSGNGFPRILIDEILQKTELFADESANRAWDLLKAFRKVAQILQSL